ncbi:MAG: hypothetical protein JNJ86_16875 [Chitinophagaceae bacterium]|nr:hypothetical protein [Chitinophagaceae bacterium]
MEKQFKKASGICLLLGSALATFTMAMHPVGGSLAEIARKKGIFIFSHSLAILSIPFIAFGFWGLSTALATKSRISYLSFAIGCFGLMAVLIAGTVNGFVLPSFASNYSDNTVDWAVLQAIRNYGWLIGKSMDYIFITALMLAIAIWSSIIITSGQLSKWLGYYGFLIVIVTTSGLLMKFNFTSAFGFGLFIFSLVSWKLIAAFLLISSSKKI